MPSVEVNIEVYCQTCGTGLCQYSEGVSTRTRGEPSIRVEACYKCIERAKDEAYRQGCDDTREELGE